MGYQIANNLHVGKNTICFNETKGEMKYIKNRILTFLLKSSIIRCLFGFEKESIGKKVFFISKKEIEKFKSENHIQDQNSLDLNVILKTYFSKQKSVTIPAKDPSVKITEETQKTRSDKERSKTSPISGPLLENVSPKVKKQVLSCAQKQFKHLSPEQVVQVLNNEGALIDLTKENLNELLEALTEEEQADLLTILPSEALQKLCESERFASEKEELSKAATESLTNFWKALMLLDSLLVPDRSYKYRTKKEKESPVPRVQSRREKIFARERTLSLPDTIAKKKQGKIIQQIKAVLHGIRPADRNVPFIVMRGEMSTMVGLEGNIRVCIRDEEVQKELLGLLGVTPPAKIVPKPLVFPHPVLSKTSSYKPAEFQREFKSDQRAALKKIAQQTKQMCLQDSGKTIEGYSGYPALPAGITEEARSAMQKGTEVYTWGRSYTIDGLPKKKSKRTRLDTTFSVVKQDTINAVLELQVKGRNPVALNMANASIPGGHWESGALAQEEVLFFRSNYFQSLDLGENPVLKRQGDMEEGYQIPERGVIYSPNVQVFRGDMASGFPILEQPIPVSFIACAAFNLNSKEGRKKYSDEAMKAKINAILVGALTEGHDSIVLGALGCGMFGNDPENIARLFDEVLQEESMKGCFQEVVFAILGGPQKNYEAFAKRFATVK